MKKYTIVAGVNGAGKTTLYDNTDEFRRFAIYKDGVLVRKSHLVPDWFEKIQ